MWLVSVNQIESGVAPGTEMEGRRDLLFITAGAGKAVSLLSRGVRRLFRVSDECGSSSTWTLAVHC